MYAIDTRNYLLEYNITMISLFTKGGKILEEVLKLENISKIYQAKNGEVEALKNVNLTVYEGELVSIIGPSGSRENHLAFNNCWIRA